MLIVGQALFYTSHFYFRIRHITKWHKRKDFVTILNRSAIRMGYEPSLEIRCYIESSHSKSGSRNSSDISYNRSANKMDSKSRTKLVY